MVECLAKRPARFFSFAMTPGVRSGLRMGLLLCARPGERQLRLGELIDLRRPDGTTIRTWVDDISARDPSGFYDIHLNGLLWFEDVPAGTAVWTVDGQREADGFDLPATH